MRYRRGEPSARRVGVDGADQAGDDVAGVVAVERSAGFGTLVEFVQLPLGGITVEMGHALAKYFATPGWCEELESSDMGATRKLLALVVHPENAEGERVHR